MFDETNFENFLSHSCSQDRPVHHLFERHSQPIIRLHDDVRLLERRIHLESRILYDLCLTDRERHSNFEEKTTIEKGKEMFENLLLEIVFLVRVPLE